MKSKMWFLALLSLLLIGAFQSEQLRPVTKVGGDNWYVSGSGSNAYTGKTPARPFQTVTYAISQASDGDVITVKPGVYAEAVDLDKNYMTIIGGYGTTFTNTFTISGLANYIQDLNVVPSSSVVGLLVSGSQNRILDMNIAGTPTTGVQVTGAINLLKRVYSTSYSVAGFDFSFFGNGCFDCIATGAGGATRGFYLSNTAADSSYLDNCRSLGNATAGYEIVSGVSSTLISDSVSGGGDGRIIDAGTNTVLSNYSFEDIIYTDQTFAGGSPGAVNIFQVTGTVEIEYIYGEVNTVLSADVGNCYLGLYDSTATIEITDDGGGGSDISSAPVGSIIIKTDVATTAITLKSSAAGFIQETTAKDPRAKFIIGQKNGANTYIQSIVDGVATSGVIRWYVKWRPLNSGFLEAI